MSATTTAVETPERTEKQEADAKIREESKRVAQAWLVWEINAQKSFALQLGKKCTVFLEHCHETGMGEKLGRAMLAQDILDVTGTDYTAEIGRSIKAYQLTLLIGGEVLDLPVDMQKALTRFAVQDGDTRIWHLDPESEARVKKLVAKTLADEKRVTCEQFRKLLERIKPSRAAAKDPGPEPDTDDEEVSVPITIPDPSAHGPRPKAPGDCIDAIEDLLRGTDDHAEAMRLLGQRREAEEMVEVVAGFITRLTTETPRKAREGFDLVYSVFSERGAALTPSKPHKS